MPGTLFVVATPIGNLDDITLRALQVLRTVDVIAAEDTRRTSRLLAHHGIQTPTISFHAHNIRRRTPQLLARLEAGESVAVVTDAGTPGLSDPGVELVQACIEKGIAVDPIPGPSAFLVAALGSGFPLVPLTFLGFAPSRSLDRMRFFQWVAQISHTVIFYETPHRIKHSLTEASSVLGDRPIVLGRELTKRHQEFLRGTAEQLARQLDTPRGEFTVVVGPVVDVNRKSLPHELPSDEQLLAEFSRMTEHGGSSRRQSIAAVARKFGRPPREVYSAIERAKRSV